MGGALQSVAEVPAYTYLVRGTGQASATVVSGSFTGKPTANLILQTYVFAMPAAILPVGLAGSWGTAAIPASGRSIFSIQKNGLNIGTMSFVAAANMATFTMSSATEFAAGDVLAVIAPAVPNSTLANIAWTLMGFSQ